MCHLQHHPTISTVLRNDEYAYSNKQNYFSELSSESTQIEILGCHIIKKNGNNDIVVQKASDHQEILKVNL